MKVLHSKLIRRITQVVFFSYVLALVILKYIEEKGVVLPFSTADLHALCPFGAIESLGRLFSSGKFIPKIHESNFWVLFGTLGITALIGAYFCGWLCPLGSIQDWFSRIGKKLFRKRVKVNRRVDRVLSYGRYIFLILILVQTTRHLALVFTNIDPYYALFHFWSGEALLKSIIVLGAILLLSLFIDRPWCRWFCPLGGVLGIVQKISPWKIRRDSTSCISCNKCSKACPMSIDVAKLDKVNDSRCNRCGECVSSCPVENTLVISTKRRKGISIKNGLFTALILLTIFFTPIVAAKALGLFKTTNKVEVVTGTLTPEDIKGSITIKELSDGFNIPADKILDYLGLPSDLDLSTKVRDLEDIDESITLPVIRDKMILWH